MYIAFKNDSHNPSYFPSELSNSKVFLNQSNSKMESMKLYVVMVYLISLFCCCFWIKQPTNQVIMS